MQSVLLGLLFSGIPSKMGACSYSLEDIAMYTLVRQSSVQSLLLVQGPALLVSLIIAEVFYKFHSFTLECLAFLATWGAVDWIISNLFGGRKPQG
jgi:hypothetical protein